MHYMLDTNICSYVLRDRPPSFRKRFEKAGAGNLAISTVVLAELYFGAARHPKGDAIRREIDDFASRITIIPWDENAADHYGDIRAMLEKKGTPIGAMDMMIAAHARSIGAVLVSNDVSHFDKVRGLRITNWV
jgi:tRNA(fMet)-specific endonuclease VapC